VIANPPPGPRDHAAVPALQAHSAAPRLPLAPHAQPQEAAAHAATSNVAGAAPVVPSAQLLGAYQAIEIDHNGQRYRLQSTRSGKLILTK
jgi:hemin uptake protein HemP